MKKLQPIIFSLLIMSGVSIYYGVSNYVSGQVSLKNLIIGGAFCLLCIVFFLRFPPDTATSKKKNQFISIIISIFTIAALFLLSAISYIKAGAFMGMIVGASAGGMFFGRLRNLSSFSRYLAPAIIGAAIFFPLRDITFDVQTMASRSLEPRVRQGQKILINNLAFGAKVPFLPLTVISWGKPEIGDLVIVSGTNGRPYLREVLNIEGTRAFLNTDGWISHEKLLAKATSL